jgi:radical SAM superfamily enzyme YgiQ (UPF0313 family)
MDSSLPDESMPVALVSCLLTRYIVREVVLKVLLVYPEHPVTYWSFHYALRFLGKKAALPPLGALTVAALLPESWDVRLVDMNAARLRDKDLQWADAVMISAMVVQQESAREVISRARQAGKTIIAGGPLFTCEPDRFPEVDHLVLGEAEATLPAFLDDFIHQRARRRYEPAPFPAMDLVPIPRWDLLDVRKYASLSIQFSRGCPFDCDFCNVTALFGHRPRTKSSAQILAELEALWECGWRGSVFFVDDNFIGNKRYLKHDLLPALLAWQQSRKNGFTFYTEASINLADDPDLMLMMFEAGFNSVFIGLETPSEQALADCNKKQNQGRDLAGDIRKIQRAGMQVQGGFIVGFDSDTESIFERQLNFIQDSGIVTAMVGILQAPVGTKLHARLRQENRLVGETAGNNTSSFTNVIPKMDLSLLVDGYHRLVNKLYSPKTYYSRVRTFLAEFKAPTIQEPIRLQHLRACLNSLIRQGLFDISLFYYWKLMLWVSVRKPRLLPTAFSLAIMGHHFRKVSRQINREIINIAPVPGK